MIRWLLGHDTPALNEAEICTPAERADGQRFRHPGRRRQWLLGRATAKTLILRHVRESGRPIEDPRRLSILTAGSGTPRVILDDTELPLSLSISHSGDTALCAVCQRERGRLGVDIERVEPRSAAFASDYFTRRELELAESLDREGRDFALTLFWCAKEAVLKALGTGLGRDPREVEVLALPASGNDPARSLPVKLADRPAPAVCCGRLEGMACAMAVLPERCH
ncbi:MAG: 4'-phosphopantetheinyl transferase superfamily protein [Myxococcales bacterium]|nr:4'-phosphopantetheinyl transferase superfamily protein [Myxococcales bacterium]